VIEENDVAIIFKPVVEEIAKRRQFSPDELRAFQNRFTETAEPRELSADERRTITDTILKIQNRLQRRRWISDPAIWIEERLGEATWSKQREICKSVVDNKKTAVPSCFASGKSWLAARIAAWWVDSHPPGTARVVTTASSFSQVKAILWMELGRAHSKGRLLGRLNQTEWYVVNPETGKEELVAFGKKPQDMDPTAFQGIHAPYVLVILDEAAGVPTTLYLAADALVVNDESRMLAIGNPEDGASEFEKICRPGSGWNVIRIRAVDTPNFTNEDVPEPVKQQLLSSSWVEDKRLKWGETSPMWLAKVEAVFPEVRVDGLIPIAWIRAAQERNLTPGTEKNPEGKPNELGMDVGGGGNKSTVAHRRGGWCRIIYRGNNPDTMATCGDAIAILDKTGASCLKVDEIGIGRGLVDRARELEPRRPVLGINVSMQSKDQEHYINLRAAAWWGIRERFESGDIDIDPNDEDTVAQLVELRYKRTSRGQIQIESKEEMKRRNIPSPDDADAIMLAFLPEEVAPRAPRLRQISWG
jgi:hypothetical protein